MFPIYQKPKRFNGKWTITCNILTSKYIRKRTKWNVKVSFITSIESHKDWWTFFNMKKMMFLVIAFADMFESNTDSCSRKHKLKYKNAVEDVFADKAKAHRHWNSFFDIKNNIQDIYIVAHKKRKQKEEDRCSIDNPFVQLVVNLYVERLNLFPWFKLGPAWTCLLLIRMISYLLINHFNMMKEFQNVFSLINLIAKANNMETMIWVRQKAPRQFQKLRTSHKSEIETQVWHQKINWRQQRR